MYKSNFVIYDTGDTQTVVKKVIKELNLDDKQYNPGAIRNAISNAKNQMLGPLAFEAQARLPRYTRNIRQCSGRTMPLTLMICCW